ncbi:unnamed protein product [Closterium sp. NIES-54]
MIRSKRWGTWWTAANGAKWEGRIAARDTAMPEPSQALTVIRVSHTEIKFLTPSNTYLTKAQGVFGYLRTTRNVSNPRSVFTIKYIPRTAYVAFRSSDGYFATQDGKNSPQFKWKRAGEWERYDVREVMEVPAIRGANLGSWLMTEPWMNRDVFKFAGYGDGTRFTLRSVMTGKYITAPGGGGTIMRCNDSLTTKDTYMHLTTVENASPNTRRISVQWLQYWAVRSNSKYVWVQSTKPEGTASNFELYIFGTPLNESTEQSGGSVCVVLRAPNGLFVQARTDGSLTADLQHSLSNVAIWSSAAAFDLTVLWRVEGDFQAAFTAGAAAPSLYENIRRNFLTEEDWQKMQELGINTVRIPLPYWIALDASPEFPFVPGAATYLDWAFEMGRKYGVRIWFSVHVAPGSQAGRGNARDGLVRWQGENINRTVDFVTWLADRYGTDPMWLGMGLLNEPVVPGANGYAGVDLEDMRGYYSAAFNAIRARCLCCFVAMEGRVGSNFGDVMWHMSDAWHNNVILEQHIYEVFGNFFSSKGVDWEIEYAHTTRKDNIIAFQQRLPTQQRQRRIATRPLLATKEGVEAIRPHPRSSFQFRTMAPANNTANREGNNATDTPVAANANILPGTTARRPKRAADESREDLATGVEVLLGGGSQAPSEEPSAPRAASRQPREVAKKTTADAAVLTTTSSPSGARVKQHSPAPSSHTPATTEPNPPFNPAQLQALLALLQQHAPVTAGTSKNEDATTSAKYDKKKEEAPAVAPRPPKTARIEKDPAPAPVEDDSDESDDADGEASPRRHNPIFTHASCSTLPPLNPATTNSTFNRKGVRDQAEVFSAIQAHLRHIEFKLQQGDAEGARTNISQIESLINKRFEVLLVADEAGFEAADRFQLYQSKSVLTSRSYKLAVADVAASKRARMTYTRPTRGGGLNAGELGNKGSGQGSC